MDNQGVVGIIVCGTNYFLILWGDRYCPAPFQVAGDEKNGMCYKALFF